MRRKITFSKNKPKSPPRQLSALGKLFNLLIASLIQEKNGVVAGVLITLIAAIAFWLSPLKEIVFHIIWKEKAVVDLKASMSSDIIYGKEFSVETAIYSDSPIPITNGVLTLIFPKDAFEVTKGKIIFQTPVIESVKLFPEGEQTLLRAIKAGKHRIICNLRTKYSDYSDTAEINVDYVVGKPNPYNWSGKWKISIGIDSGEMDIIDDLSSGGSNKITGNYYLDSGEQGIITGFRDGETFNGNMIKKPNNTKKWFLNRLPHKKSLDGRFMEISGIASLVQNFRSIDSASFYAVTRIN